MIGQRQGVGRDPSGGVLAPEVLGVSVATLVEGGVGETPAIGVGQQRLVVIAVSEPSVQGDDAVRTGTANRVRQDEGFRHGGRSWCVRGRTAAGIGATAVRHSGVALEPLPAGPEIKRRRRRRPHEDRGVRRPSTPGPELTG